MQHKKTVNGILLRRAIGQGRRWAALVDGTPMVFDATVGYRSGKPLYWTAYVHPAHARNEHGGMIQTGRANSLSGCVGQAQAWAAKEAA